MCEVKFCDNSVFHQALDVNYSAQWKHDLCRLCYAFRYLFSECTSNVPDDTEIAARCNYTVFQKNKPLNF